MLLGAADEASVAYADKEMMGAKYWHFNVNHLGQQDIEAQLDFIHNAKGAELPKELAEAAHAADVQRRRPRYRCSVFFWLRPMGSLR